MRQLLWKEWHEQSWKLGFGCIVLSAIAIIGLHARMIPDATLIEWICVLGFTMLPILSSTGLVPAEREAGSLESLLAMPVAPWKILTAKTAMGILLCVGPLMVAAVVSVMMAGGREVLSSQIFEQFARAALAAVSLLIWMIALTIRLPSETRAALLSVGILISWAIASSGLAFSSLLSSVYALSPAVFVFHDVPNPHAAAPPMLQQGRIMVDMLHAPSLPIDLLAQIILLGIVWAISVRMFIRPVEGNS